jgi:dihydrolipoamide dehydrogenase
MWEFWQKVLNRGILWPLNWWTQKAKKRFEILEVDACLVATGRIPATKNLGLEFVGVELDKRGFIAVNDKMQVIQDGEPIPHLWARGRCYG